MFTVYKTTTFESAHLLEGHPKCGKLHGHSYKAEFWVTTEALTEPHGFVIDFHFFSDLAKTYDHSDIVIKISCEELAEAFCEQVRNQMSAQSNGLGAKIKVRIWETATSSAQYEVRVTETV